MRKDIAGPEGESTRPMWESLEGAVREKAQEFIQQILEEEVTELQARLHVDPVRPGWPRGISSWRSGAYLVRGRRTPSCVSQTEATPYSRSGSGPCGRVSSRRGRSGTQSALRPRSPRYNFKLFQS